MENPRCIFCQCEGDVFHTIEHIVPESLGNTDDILENAVCDKCQNYLGREIENYVLSKTPFGFWRTMAGTPSKKGKPPMFNPSQKPSTSGKTFDFHPFTDNGFVIHPMNGESIIEVEATDKTILEDIINEKRSSFKIVMTPKMLIMIGRFLGKIGIEYWYREFGNNVFEKDFDELRNYVRNGTTKYIWPIFHGQLQGNLLEYKRKNTYEEERVLYQYQIFQIHDLIFFCFDIGTEYYSIILNKQYPEIELLHTRVLPALANYFGEIPQILYYPL